MFNPNTNQQEEGFDVYYPTANGQFFRMRHKSYGEYLVVNLGWILIKFLASVGLIVFTTFFLPILLVVFAVLIAIPFVFWTIGVYLTDVFYRHMGGAGLPRWLYNLEEEELQKYIPAEEGTHEYEMIDFKEKQEELFQLQSLFYEQQRIFEDEYHAFVATFNYDPLGFEIPNTHFINIGEKDEDYWDRKREEQEKRPRPKICRDWYQLMKVIPPPPPRER